MSRQVLLVTTQSLEEHKTLRHKMSYLNKVALPHKLLHSNNSGPKIFCEFLPYWLQSFTFKHHVSLIPDSMQRRMYAKALGPGDSRPPTTHNRQRVAPHSKAQ